MHYANFGRSVRAHARWLLWTAVAIVLVKITQEVLEKDAIPAERLIMLGIHDVVPARWVSFFKLITMTGSSMVLIPVVACIAAAFWFRKHKFEAVQLAVTTMAAGLVIYLAKAAVGRVRPDLWEAKWYWGSSFPSGHTLSTAAVATACWLAVSRVWPHQLTRATVVLGTWVALVGFSRLVLGVHWPTDVAAAACAGLLVAVGANGLVLRGARASGLQ